MTRVPIVAILLLCRAVTAADEPAVRFDTDILPILAANCLECHGPDADAREADLRLDSASEALKQRDGRAAIVAGDAARSELVRRVRSTDPETVMPPPDSGRALSERQKRLLERWISAGAAWRRHWAFETPRRPPTPEVVDRDWPRNAIDRFVLARLEKKGWSPAPEADRSTLLRRLSLDLTGLPPTPSESRAFLADRSPDAYERLVDRLLASPRYGERMAVPWLDAGRFADTHGYLFDTQRTMWRWRDWLIDALNRNQPYDQLTIEQIAGDLLPNATLSQKIASGFQRNHIINNEAGATPAEYLVENVVDRVNTTATVWMGLSLQCCQCHDHKYDPFTQRDYYRLYAFFNNIPELGLDGLNSNAKPTVQAPTTEHRAALANLRERIGAAESEFGALAEEIREGQLDWEQTPKPQEKPPRDALAAHWAFDASGADSVAAAVSSTGEGDSKRAGSPQASDAPAPEDSNPKKKTSAAGNEATFEAAPAVYENGVLGKAAVFGGLGYVNIGDRFNFSRDQSFTLTAWVRPTVKAGRFSIVSRMKNAESLFRGYTLQLVQGFPAFFLVHSFPDNMIQVQGKQALEPNRWSHLAVTYNGLGKASGVKLYLNGKLQKKRGPVIDKLTEPIVNDAPFWIGNGHPGAKFKGRVDETRVYRRVLRDEEVTRLPGLAIGSLVSVATSERNDEQRRRIRDHYLAHHAPPEWREAHQKLAGMRAELTKMERGLPTVMVMRELKKPRDTRILNRGAYNQPGAKVTAGTPAVLPAMKKEWPRNRLGLARWLVDPQHPLTARVAVNRMWELHFGAGLAETSEDFGIRGQPPSHPQLMDWLATEFVRGGWDLKALQRRIVMSATYRQASRMSAESVARDPENRWLSRGPRHRLPAEVIRDQALASSGLLVERLGGPSVKPYQPGGLWREVAFDFTGANLTAQIYKQDRGANLYRRGLYTFWKRTSPPPTMLLFDAPDRERCVVRRVQTNTPLQALALLNDPTFVEAARRLAQRVLLEGGKRDEGRIRRAFQWVLAREPLPRESALLVALFREQKTKFASIPEQAQLLLKVGESSVASHLDPAELAALTIVANTLLNLDETVTKR